MGKICNILCIALIVAFASGCGQDTSREETIDDDSVSSEVVEDDSVDHTQWIGTWEREGAIDPASIAITNITDSEFEFHLNAYDGINTRELSGAATIEDSMALFIATETEDTCRISFVMQDSLLIINQMDKNCSGATDINFSGEYFHERFFKNKTMDEDAAIKKEELEN